MTYVITCGDEGIQINEGTRLGVVGSGVKLEGSKTVISYLKELFGTDLCLVSNEESAWIREQFELNTWEQANATYQQQSDLIADQTGISYAGFIEFADPRQLECGIKGHMVRPKGIHIANGISLT